MSVTVKVNLGKLENTKLDLTKELLHAADLVSQEMRGNIKAGMDASGQTLTPNAPSYAKRKLKELGHARPLIAKHRTIVTPASYVIKEVGLNHVRITMPGKHPRSELTIGQIAGIHQTGAGKNPVRAFVGVTEIAKKRVMAYLFKEIRDAFK